MTKTKPALGALVVIALICGSVALVQGGGEGVGVRVGAEKSASGGRLRADVVSGSTRGIDSLSTPVPGSTLTYPEYEAQLQAEADRVAAEAQQAEAQRLADEAQALAEANARSIAPRPSVAPQTGPPVVVSGDCSAFLGVVSGAIIQRESGGNPNAVNSSSGALGCAQLLPQHFSPNGFGTGAAGSCADLNPAVLADQVTCASRLPASAWGG